MSSNIIINSTPDSIFHLIHFWRQCYTIITTNIRYRMNNCGGGLVSSSTRSEGGKNVTKKYLNSITLKNQLEIWVDIEGESKFYSNCISNLSAFRVSNLPSRIWSSFIFNCLIEFCPPSPPIIGDVVKLIRCDSILLFTGQQLATVNKRIDSSFVLGCYLEAHWKFINKTIFHHVAPNFVSTSKSKSNCFSLGMW